MEIDLSSHLYLRGQTELHAEAKNEASTLQKMSVYTNTCVLNG